MPGFLLPIDIGNRGLQHVGIGADERIIVWGADGVGDDSKARSEVWFCYDKLRLAELRDNVWRFAIRKAILRPLGPSSMQVTFATWNPATAYVQNFVVAYGGLIYFRKVAGTTATSPDQDFTNWGQFFGSTVACSWSLGSDPSAPQPWLVGTNYPAGVEVVGSDGYVYYGVSNGNIGHDPTTDGGVHWTKIAIATTSAGYYAGELVYDNSNVVYLSMTNGNSDDPPTSNWVTLTGATLSAINLIWPIGAGPSNQSQTRNVYQLPNGFLREAPQDPKAGSSSFLGAPTGRAYDDWTFEGNFFTTREVEPITFRFVADIADVTLMDPEFCEALAARIGMEVCEPLTQSSEKVNICARMYTRSLDQAATTNGIENGPIEAPEDDWLTCRV